MKIKIIKGFCLGAGRDVQPGDVVEVGEQQAAALILQGRAAEYSEPVRTEPKPRKGAFHET